jgi:hypothetical protein
VRPGMMGGHGYVKVDDHPYAGLDEHDQDSAQYHTPKRR